MAPTKKIEKPKKTVSKKLAKRVTKSSRSGISFPVGRIQRFLREGNYAARVGTLGAVYAASVLEYLTAEILEIAGQHSKANNKVRINPRHIMRAIKEDSELSELLKDVHVPYAGVMPYIHPVLLPKSSKKKANTERMEESGTESDEKTQLEGRQDDQEEDIELDTTNASNELAF